jgi:hypothetical protein
MRTKKLSVRVVPCIAVREPTLAAEENASPPLDENPIKTS